jgi:isopenicillin-N epimerase
VSHPLAADVLPARRDAWQLDPAVTFLNHGSFGATPRAVLQRQAELRNELETQPVAFMLDRVEALIDASRETLARFLNASPQTLAFVPNATTGVNSALRSASIKPGDELLTTSHAYGACSNALRAIAEERGATVRVVVLPFPFEHSAQHAHDLIMAAVTPRTRLLLLDHVTSATGLVLPAANIIESCRTAGIITVVDGAHAPGMISLDLSGLGADYYIGNCHKWLCAPKGAAFICAHPDRVATLRPVVVSHGATMPTDRRSRFHLEFDWIGTIDPTPWICVGTAIDTLAQLDAGGWPAVRASNHALCLAGRDLLLDALNVAAPAPDAMIGSIVSVPLPDDPTPQSAHPYRPHELQLSLLHRHHIEVVVTTFPRWPNRLLRISAQRYNQLADYERLSSALRLELARE